MPLQAEQRWWLHGAESNSANVFADLTDRKMEISMGPGRTPGLMLSRCRGDRIRAWQQATAVVVTGRTAEETVAGEELG